MSRDLVGYSGRWSDIWWPNGAQLAVSLVVKFEEGAEMQVGDGDPRSEAKRIYRLYKAMDLQFRNTEADQPSIQ